MEAPESSQFLGEVLANPDDDLPRLAYADWLSENGDPRGEFIRAQCLLSKVTDQDPEYYDLHPRQLALLNEFGKEWAEDLSQDVRKSEFRRGFIDNVTIRARAFVDGGADLFRSVPVHWLRFNYIKGAGESLAKQDSLSQIRHLDLSGLKIPIEDFQQLITSPNLSNLRSLDLDFLQLRFNSQLGTIIGSCPSMPGISNLALRCAQLDSQFFTALAQSDLSNVDTLTVGGEGGRGKLGQVGLLQTSDLKSLKVRGRIGVADAEGLLGLPIQNLKELDLAGTGIPAKGLDGFGAEGALSSVERLDLSGCNLGLRAVQNLFSSDYLQRCRVLDISDTHGLAEAGHMPKLVTLIAGHEPLSNLHTLSMSEVSGDAWEILGQAECLSQLRSLYVDSGAIDETGGNVINQGPWSNSLRKLTIRPHFENAAARYFADEPFPELLSLSFHVDMFGLGEHHLRVEGDIHWILGSRAFPKLRRLELDHLRLDNKSLDIIADSQGFPELRELSFIDNRVTESAVRHFFESPNLPNLKRLIINERACGAKARRRLAEDYGSRLEISPY